MVSVGLGIPNHDVLPGVSSGDHHAEIDASDLNLADLAERSHVSLTGVTEAQHVSTVTVAEMEAEAAVNRSLNPSRVRNNPGVAKAWVSITTAGAIGENYNIASITDTATGNRTIVFDDDFSTAGYVSVPGTNESVAAPETQVFLTPAVGDVVLNCYDGSSSLVDRLTGQVFYGDQ